MSRATVSPRASTRYVLLVLGSGRTGWDRMVTGWADSSTIAAEVDACVSHDEAMAKLRSGRRYSAALFDSSLPALDRDLLGAAASAACAPMVVQSPGGARDWVSLGAVSVLRPSFTAAELLAALRAHAGQVPWADDRGWGDEDRSGSSLARLVAVCGPGGTGSSTIAMALAQGLAARSPAAWSVCLADLALHAELSMLHGTPDVLPCVQDLVEAHRSGELSVPLARSLTFAIEARGYSLLLGLASARSWPAVRGRSFRAALATLCDAYSAVVCDMDASFETEDTCGSMEVEERNVMALTTARRADIVLVVGGGTGVKELHSITRALSELADAGVDLGRALPVVNRVDHRARWGRGSSGVAKVLSELGWGGTLPPVAVPDRTLDDVLRDGSPMPRPIVAAVTDAVAEALVSMPRPAEWDGERKVRPGELGCEQVG